jgi:hypothetical protein
MLGRTGGFTKIPEEPGLRLLAPPPLRLAIAMLAFKLGSEPAEQRVHKISTTRGLWLIEAGMSPKLFQQHTQMLSNLCRFLMPHRTHTPQTPPQNHSHKKNIVHQNHNPNMDHDQATACVHGFLQAP